MNQMANINDGPGRKGNGDSYIKPEKLVSVTYPPR